MTLLGKVYIAVVEERSLDLPHICHGCASGGLDSNGNHECDWWAMRIEDLQVGQRVFTAAQIHLGDCGPMFQTDKRRYFKEVVPIASAEPGENGYVPDSFLPGNDIHAVTKLLCK